jgi:hypothetical protein
VGAPFPVYSPPIRSPARAPPDQTGVMADSRGVSRSVAMWAAHPPKQSPAVGEFQGCAADRDSGGVPSPFLRSEARDRGAIIVIYAFVLSEDYSHPL